MKAIQVPPLRWYEYLFDIVLVPCMYLVSETFSERPQETHRWNLLQLRKEFVRRLLPNIMVHNKAVPGAKRRWLWKIPLFHIPILGGWRDYVVLAPVHDTGVSWHVGWIAGETVGVTRHVHLGPVRVLLGDEDVFHFGLDGAGNQIGVKQIGVGRIGTRGPFSKLRFF